MIEIGLKGIFVINSMNLCTGPDFSYRRLFGQNQMLAFTFHLKAYKDVHIQAVLMPSVNLCGTRKC